MGLMAFIKFGYALVLVTLLLMIWASLSRAIDIHVDTGHPPCQFQALCTCSKPGGDLGIVTCNYAPIARVPPIINSSKVYVLQLQGNRIRELEPQFFQSTGLYKLAINENPLEMIHDEAFYGLDNTLWELELKRDELTEVPSRALRYLQKLRILDLTGNQISEVTGDNWRGLENTLQTLILADNSITSLPLDVFSGLPMLEVLDLSGNHLALIDNGVFRDGMNRLKELYLQDNQLIYIPYEQVAPLRLLRVLDLSKNVIKQVPPAHELNALKLNLDSLLLNDNVIRSLLPGAFKYFNMLNHTSLDGNPIYDLREDAFRNAKIKSLSLRDCGLLELSPAAFAGLENSLTTLDLSQNNLTALSKFMLNKLDALRSLNLKENKVDVNYLSLGSPSDYSGPTFNSFQYKLFYLDISGAASLEMTMQDVRRMRSLRYLSVGKLLRKSLRAEDFLEFGVELEDLKITGSTINSIETSAFEHVRTIKTLDLSENNIEFIDPFAFAELHSLTTLKMANGLHEYVKILPFEPLKALIELQYLDFSNNKLKNVPDTSFHFLYKLKTLNLQDNLIHHFAKGTLQGDIHKQLEYISLSLNQLRLLEQHTFVDLKEIKEILIEDNFIEMIYRRAFTGLDNLKVIRLKGNKIIEISEEAFQTLPALQELDISFNRLETFRFSIFDQVGSATALKVNASYNYIYALTDSIAPSYYANSLYYQPKTAGFFYDETRPYGQSGFLQQRPYDPRDPNFQRPYLNGEQRVFPTTDYERQRELGIRSEYDPRRPNDPLRPDYDPRRQDYDTRRPDYDPRRQDYDPRRPDYDPRRDDYDPLRPEYNQRRPEYDPNRPEYDPTRPEYDPTRPDYDPRRPDRPLNGYGARPYQQGLSTVSVNIRVLDFSHNNITYIAPYYFRHADLTLSELHLSHNLIRNVSRDVFGSMTWLQYLDLSHNQVFDLEYDCFKRAKNLQFIDLSHNFITELPLEIFRDMLALTVVDLSDNFIRNLPDNLIPSPSLERLDLSNNKLSRVPTNMLSPAAAHNLVELDLSRNTIPAISMADFVLRYRNGESTGEYWVDEPDYSDEYMYHTARRDHQRVYHQKKQYPQNILYKSLAYLNLRDNHLVRIEPGTFTALPRLKWLDLSNNSPFNVEKGNMIFRGLERRLLHLGMRNVSLTFMPSLPLPRLKSLDLSSNNLPSLAPDTTANLTRLTSLDLSFNDLTAVPVAAHTCNELRWLSLSGNPISAFLNTSLYGLSPKLEYLDVTNLRVRMLEHGLFNKMFALRTLKITAYTNAKEFNLPKMLTNNAALKNLYIDVEDPSTNLGRELSGSLPCKLNNITFTGKALKFISEYILSGVHSRQLRLTIYNTSVETIDSAVFWNPGRVRNITLDLRSNTYLYRVPNPGQREWPGVPNSVFLQDIMLAGNPLECDCGIGWVEAWDRKRRQYLCPSPWNCITTRDDIRFARCPSYYNRTLIDVLSRDLECGFGSGYLSLPNILLMIPMAAIAIFYS